MIEKYIGKTKTVSKINGYVCHSIYDPIKEAKLFVDKNKEDVQIHFIYGYGDGYIVEEFLNRLEDNETYYIVIDPFIDISMKKSPNAIFINYIDVINLKEDIEKFVDWQYNRKLTLSPNYDKMDLEKYQLFLKMFNEINHLSNVNANTISLRAEEWYKNYLFNMKYLLKDKSLAEMKNSTNKPVVVASGGPSLTKQLPYLKRYRSSILLIAAGSTVNSLIAADIIPDIVVSIDGHINNYKHFEKIIFNEKVKFFYTMYSYFKIREKFKEGYYFLDSISSNLCKHLECLTNESSIAIEGGGSVAHFSLNIATYISTGPVALIGQDLAYTNGKSHAENNIFIKSINLKDENFIEIEGYNNEKVYTDYMFLSMKKTFEELIKVLDKTRIYNCTEGGALLKGYQNKKFEDFCKESTTIKDLQTKKTKSVVNNKQKSLKVIKENIAIYERLLRITKQNLYLLQSNKKTANFSKETLKKLDSNDKRMKELCKDNPIETAFRAVDLHVNRSFKKMKYETPQQEYERVYNQNEYLYSEMNRFAKIGKEILTSIIK